MAYEGLVELLEKHKGSIAYEAATEIIKNNVKLYSAMTVDQLSRRNLRLLQIVIQYLRTGNVEEYRNSIKTIIETRRQEGFSSQEIGSRTMFLVEKVKETIQRELPGPENEKTRNDYISRINGMTALARVSTLSTLLKKDE